MGITNDIVLVTGKSGTGKSYFTGWLLVQFRKKGKRVVIWDRKNEYRDLVKSVFILDAKAMAQVVKLGAGFFLKLFEKVKDVRIIPQGLALDEVMAAADALAEAIYETGNTVVLLEEAHVIAPQGQTPRYLQILITDARTNGNDVIMVAQRAQLLDTTMVSQANARVTFKLTDINDLKRVSTFFANPDPKKYQSALDYIAAMPPFVALYANERSGQESVIHTTKINGFTHHG